MRIPLQAIVQSLPPFGHWEQLCVHLLRLRAEYVALQRLKVRQENGNTLADNTMEKRTRYYNNMTIRSLHKEDTINTERQVKVHLTAAMKSLATGSSLA